MASMTHFRLHMLHKNCTHLCRDFCSPELSLCSSLQKMVKSCSIVSSSPSPSPANDELDSLRNAELISFLESSFRRSEFIRVADILKSREDLAKGEALRDLPAKVSRLEAKARSLEKELGALRNNEHVGRLKEMEKLAAEKVKFLTEEVDKERANCLRIEEQLEKQRNERIAEVDSWRSKYSLLEAWTLRFLEDNHCLVEKVREQDMNGKKQNLNFFRTSEEAEKLRRNNVDFGKKKSSVAAGDKSKAVSDHCRSEIESFSDSFQSKKSVMKNFDSNDKNCSKRKFQTRPTFEVEEVLELDDDDDVICIKEVMAKKFAKRSRFDDDDSDDVVWIR